MLLDIAYKREREMSGAEKGADFVFCDEFSTGWDDVDESKSPFVRPPLSSASLSASLFIREDFPE